MWLPREDHDTLFLNRHNRPGRPPAARKGRRSREGSRHGLAPGPGISKRTSPRPLPWEPGARGRAGAVRGAGCTLGSRGRAGCAAAPVWWTPPARDQRPAVRVKASLPESSEHRFGADRNSYPGSGHQAGARQGCDAETDGRVWETGRGSSSSQRRMSLPWVQVGCRWGDAFIPVGRSSIRGPQVPSPSPSPGVPWVTTLLQSQCRRHCILL